MTRKGGVGTWASNGESLRNRRRHSSICLLVLFSPVIELIHTKKAFFDDEEKLVFRKIEKGIGLSSLQEEYRHIANNVDTVKATPEFSNERESKNRRLLVNRAKKILEGHGGTNSNSNPTIGNNFSNRDETFDQLVDIYVHSVKDAEDRDFDGENPRTSIFSDGRRLLERLHIDSFPEEFSVGFNLANTDFNLHFVKNKILLPQSATHTFTYASGEVVGNEPLETDLCYYQGKAKILKNGEKSEIDAGRVGISTCSKKGIEGVIVLWDSHDLSGVLRRRIFTIQPEGSTTQSISVNPVIATHRIRLLTESKYNEMAENLHQFLRNSEAEMRKLGKPHLSEDDDDDIIDLSATPFETNLLPRKTSTDRFNGITFTRLDKEYYWQRDGLSGDGTKTIFSDTTTGKTESVDAFIDGWRTSPIIGEAPVKSADKIQPSTVKSDGSRSNLGNTGTTSNLAGTSAISGTTSTSIPGPIGRQPKRRLSSHHSLIKYVEILVVNDRKRLDSFEGDVQEMVKNSLSVMNEVNTFYLREDTVNGWDFDFRIVVVGQHTFLEKDPWDSANYRKGSEVYVDRLLNLFHLWAVQSLETTGSSMPAHDNRVLLSGQDFDGSTVGLAGLGTMCRIPSSGSVNMCKNGDPLITCALIVSHELGHNLGMHHDGTSEGVIDNSACPTSGFIMEAVMSLWPPSSFSNCSTTNIDHFFGDTGGMSNGGMYAQNGACLENSPVFVMGDAVCGNGLVEKGEECDCGLTNCSSIDPCCNAQTCNFTTTSMECSDLAGPCCNNCMYRRKEEKYVCRGRKDPFCDLVDFCPGGSEECSRDIYAYPGTQCSMSHVGFLWNTTDDSPTTETFTADYTGLCAGGICNSVNKTCNVDMTRDFSGRWTLDDICAEQNDKCDYLICSEADQPAGKCGRSFINHGKPMRVPDGMPCFHPSGVLGEREGMCKSGRCLLPGAMAFSSVCGNGGVDFGEECDCGGDPESDPCCDCDRCLLNHDSVCSAKDPCCYVLYPPVANETVSETNDTNETAELIYVYYYVNMTNKTNATDGLNYTVNCSEDINCSNGTDYVWITTEGTEATLMSYMAMLYNIIDPNNVPSIDPNAAATQAAQNAALVDDLDKEEDADPLAYCINATDWLELMDQNDTLTFLGESYAEWEEKWGNCTNWTAPIEHIAAPTTPVPPRNITPITRPQCRYRSPETMCRASVDMQCDTPEYCTGKSGRCPADDGEPWKTPCSYHGDPSICWAKKCVMSRDAHCDHISNALNIYGDNTNRNRAYSSFATQLGQENPDFYNSCTGQACCDANGQNCMTATVSSTFSVDGENSTIYLGAMPTGTVLTNGMDSIYQASLLAIGYNLSDTWAITRLEGDWVCRAGRVYRNVNSTEECRNVRTYFDKYVGLCVRCDDACVTCDGPTRLDCTGELCRNGYARDTMGNCGSYDPNLVLPSTTTTEAPPGAMTTTTTILETTTTMEPTTTIDPLDVQFEYDLNGTSGTNNDTYLDSLFFTSSSTTTTVRATTTTIAATTTTTMDLSYDLNYSNYSNYANTTTTAEPEITTSTKYMGIIVTTLSPRTTTTPFVETTTTEPYFTFNGQKVAAVIVRQQVPLTVLVPFGETSSTLRNNRFFIKSLKESLVQSITTEMDNEIAAAKLTTDHITILDLYFTNDEGDQLYDDTTTTTAAVVSRKEATEWRNPNDLVRRDDEEEEQKRFEAVPRENSTKGGYGALAEEVIGQRGVAIGQREAIEQRSLTEEIKTRGGAGEGFQRQLIPVRTPKPGENAVDDSDTIRVRFATGEDLTPTMERNLATSDTKFQRMEIEYDIKCEDELLLGKVLSIPNDPSMKKVLKAMFNTKLEANGADMKRYQVAKVEQPVETASPQIQLPAGAGTTERKSEDTGMSTENLLLILAISVVGVLGLAILFKLYKKKMKRDAEDGSRRAAREGGSQDRKGSKDSAGSGLMRSMSIVMGKFKRAFSKDNPTEEVDKISFISEKVSSLHQPPPPPLPHRPIDDEIPYIVKRLRSPRSEQKKIMKEYRLAEKFCGGEQEDAMVLCKHGEILPKVAQFQKECHEEERANRVFDMSGASHRLSSALQKSKEKGQESDPKKAADVGDGKIHGHPIGMDVDRSNFTEFENSPLARHGNLTAEAMQHTLEDMRKNKKRKPQDAETKSPKSNRVYKMTQQDRVSLPKDILKHIDCFTPIEVEQAYRRKSITENFNPDLATGFEMSGAIPTKKPIRHWGALFGLERILSGEAFWNRKNKLAANIAAIEHNLLIEFEKLGYYVDFEICRVYDPDDRHPLNQMEIDEIAAKLNKSSSSGTGLTGTTGTSGSGSGGPPGGVCSGGGSRADAGASGAGPVHGAALGGFSDQLGSTLTELSQVSAGTMIGGKRVGDLALGDCIGTSMAVAVGSKNISSSMLGFQGSKELSPAPSKTSSPSKSFFKGSPLKNMSSMQTGPLTLGDTHRESGINVGSPKGARTHGSPFRGSSKLDVPPSKMSQTWTNMVTPESPTGRSPSRGGNSPRGKKQAMDCRLSLLTPTNGGVAALSPGPPRRIDPAGSMAVGLGSMCMPDGSPGRSLSLDSKGGRASFSPGGPGASPVPSRGIPGKPSKAVPTFKRRDIDKYAEMYSGNMSKADRQPRKIDVLDKSQVDLNALSLPPYEIDRPDLRPKVCKENQVKKTDWLV